MVAPQERRKHEADLKETGRSIGRVRPHHETDRGKTRRDVAIRSRREEDTGAKAQIARVKKRAAFQLPRDLPPAKARFIPPMKPRLIDEPPAAGDWVYELKFDGIRLIAVKNGAKVNLISRNGNELASRFPEVATAIRALPVED